MNVKLEECLFIGRNKSKILRIRALKKHHAGDLPDPRDLKKQAVEDIEDARAKLARPAVVRLHITCQHPGLIQLISTYLAGVVAARSPEPP
jgi:hypothetical protein